MKQSQPALKEHDIVAVSISNHPKLHKDEQGTIVHVYKTGQSVEVEFSRGRFKKDPKVINMAISQLKLVKSMVILLLSSMLLFSCTKEDLPKREFGTNPLEQNSGDELIVSMEARSANTGFGYHMQVAVYTSQKMELGDAQFHFSYKLSYRNKRDTVVLLVPYLFNRWVNSATVTAPPNAFASDVVFIKAENVKQKKITFKPL